MSVWFYDNVSSGVTSRNDIGERGGYSPNSATASNCEKGGNVVGDCSRSPEGFSGGTLKMGLTTGEPIPGLGGWLWTELPISYEPRGPEFIPGGC